MSPLRIHLNHLEGALQSHTSTQGEKQRSMKPTLYQHTLELLLAALFLHLF